jgi:hypothetical protein
LNRNVNTHEQSATEEVDENYKSTQNGIEEATGKIKKIKSHLVLAAYSS